MALSCARGGSGWLLGTNSSQKEKGIGTAAQGGGVTVPGGAQELWRCGTEGRGQWAQWDGLGLDLGTMEVFSNLHDSMIAHSWS